MKKQVGSILIALITLISLQSTLSAKEVCEFIFNGCPKSFNGDTLNLPEQVVALSSSILSCVDSLQYVVADSSPPPSIMFVIDNSSSMGGNSGTDRNGERFKVTKDFIDSIYNKMPKTEVGLVLFSSRLTFSTSTGEYYTEYFKTLPQIPDTVSPNQSYVKMLVLDSLYGAKKGIDILKDILATKDTTIRGNVSSQLSYTPPLQQSGTDINLGFYAAKDALKSAKNPPERQFVIFFSDGSPNGTILPDSVDNFEYGISVPTTFTIFFASSGRAPASIQTMTTNIKQNNYSKTNPNSNLWAVAANHDSLLNLLINNAMKTMVIKGNPNHMVINGVPSTGTTDTSFEFPKNFALAGDITPFTAEIKYQYTNPDNTTKDTTVTLSFVVKRTKATNLPANIGTYCWEQPTLQFYYNGSPISEATEDMKELQIRLNPNEETVVNPQVVLRSSIDSMSVTLSSANAGAYWEKSFPRATSTTATNDNILQHITGDSLIAVYHNPDLPLDSIRVAIHVKIPPKPIPPIPVTAILRDTSADGHYDRIDLIWKKDTFNIIKDLPAVNAFVSNAQITTADGTPPINLVPKAVVKRIGDTLSIILVENTGKVLETNWVSADVKVTDIVMTDKGNTLTVEKVLDGAGPFLIKSVYYPGNGSDHDTLKVVFSEPVNCADLTKGSPDQTFKYIDEGEKNQQMLIGAEYASSTCGSNSFVTEVNILLKSNGLVIPGDDSMSLVENNPYVLDKDNNRTPNNNRPVPIEWGIDNLITLGVATNPSIVGETPIPENVRRYYGITQTKGVVVGITSLKPFIKQNDGSYGSTVIYDAVGNLIMDKVPIKIAVAQNIPAVKVENDSTITTNNGIHYAVCWDWKNRHNRTVGAGTYLFIMSSKTTDNRAFSKKVKVGVKAGD